MKIWTLPFYWFHITIMDDKEGYWPRGERGSKRSKCGREWEHWISFGRMRYYITKGRVPGPRIQYISWNRDGGIYILPLIWRHLIFITDKTTPWLPLESYDTSGGDVGKEHCYNWGRLELYVCKGKPARI